MSPTENPLEASDGKRILIVEDEVLLAMDTAVMLGDLGCIVVGTAATADEAVSQAGRLRPDLVLMDIRLKGQRDGIEAAAEIHSLFGLPVIFVTAQSDEILLKRARATHPIGFLFKPFAEDDLFKTLEETGMTAVPPFSSPVS